MSGGLRFKLDIPQIISAVDGANDLAVFAMSEQVLKDSNFYCKQEYDGLIDSSLINTNISLADCGLSSSNDDMPEAEKRMLAQAEGSDLERGIIKWDMPYAKAQYELESAVKDPNQHAQDRWFDKAKDVYLDEWSKVYENAFKRGMRR